ncbi:MAG: mechanosensitive ion channel [Candidatus Eisenbacteria bacterium]|nr:mechanosensitive ion channel [Candidatus Eisenbacteria bacterium]
MAAPSESTAARRLPPVPVFLGGREVFRVLGAWEGLDPARRAQAIRSRLDAAVADESTPPDSLHFTASPDGIRVSLGKHYLWVITADDLPVREPTALSLWLSELQATLRASLVHERESRTPAQFTLSIVVALVLTLLALLVGRLLLAAGRRWRAWLGASLRSRIPALRIRDFEVASSSQLAGFLGVAIGHLDVPLGLLLVYAYGGSLRALRVDTELGLAAAALRRRAGARLPRLHQLRALPGLVTIAVLAFVFRLLVRLSNRFFGAIEQGTHRLGHFHPELARPTRRIVTIGLWITFVVIAVPYVPGAQSRAFQGVSVLVGLLLSIGSSGFVGNMIAGLVLTYSRSFRPGDRVRIGEHVGDVVSLGYFATKLRSVRNEEITIPNGQMANSTIVNYSRLAETDGLILHTEVTIGYDVAWPRVHALLIEAAGSVAGIERAPEPWVYQRAARSRGGLRAERGHARIRTRSCGSTRTCTPRSRTPSAERAWKLLSPAYHALRDANATVLPDSPKGPRPDLSGFRMRTP